MRLASIGKCLKKQCRLWIEWQVKCTLDTLSVTIAWQISWGRVGGCWFWSTRDSLCIKSAPRSRPKSNLSSATFSSCRIRNEKATDFQSLYQQFLVMKLIDMLAKGPFADFWRERLLVRRRSNRAGNNIRRIIWIETISAKTYNLWVYDKFSHFQSTQTLTAEAAIAQSSAPIFPANIFRETNLVITTSGVIMEKTSEGYDSL